MFIYTFETATKVTLTHTYYHSSVLTHSQGDMLTLYGIDVLLTKQKIAKQKIPIFSNKVSLTKGGKNISSP